MGVMRLKWILLGFFLLVCRPTWADTPQDTFLAARDAYKASDERALATYSARLQAENYALAPYLEYWRMLLRLEQADIPEVRDFLTRYADFPFSERVRVEWLKKLGKREDWDTFFDELPRSSTEDAAVSCYAISGRAAQGDAAALEQGRPLWLTGLEQPANCDDLFDRMVKAGVLTQDDLWTRFRMAMGQGKPSVAKAVLLRLPEIDAVHLKQLDRVYENPQRALEKKTVSLKTRYGRELNLFALERVSRTLPDLAQDMMNAMKGSFSQKDQHYLWGRMAMNASKRHEPYALEWYDNAGDAPLSQEQQAWKARAALRIRKWDALLATLTSMPQSMQDEPVWRYWRGRALKEQGQQLAANAVLLPLSRERTFYGLLAAEELGDIISAPPSSYKASEADLASMRQMPGIARALELHRIDMRWEARNEWAWALRNFDDRQLISAAELAFRDEWYDVAINTADKTRLTHDFALRFPTPYREQMQNYSRENGLDEAWVYGLIRQESRFVSYAKSGVGASGLMQVMPATAKWIAKRIGIAGYSHNMINELDTNIQFGTHYLRYTLDQAGGQPVVATAAYNAGLSRARRWMDAQPMEGAIYAETIPFSETRNYVQKVMSNAYYYSHQVGARLQTFKQRLGLVVGGGGAVTTTEASAQ
ncbi:soluble lytic murein transglycosylase precursor [mine drainage metagenome]|uniref:Soluble lytic murein transglycosylase n=1 Tax=mine drainage metagenome TaxID=410659 RepID=A0A1J5R3M0_9ZZZZ